MPPPAPRLSPRLSLETLARRLYRARYAKGGSFLCRDDARAFADGVIGLFFPPRGAVGYASAAAVRGRLEALHGALTTLVACVLPAKDGGAAAGPNGRRRSADPRALADALFARLEDVAARCARDAAFIAAEDPAARALEEVVACYPGFYAIAMHRLAHELHRLRLPLLPRILGEYAHEVTGVDIHPGATIGTPFFIDHGTGIVVGETTVIGDRVKVYQGVTLGALSVHRRLRDVKWHPTIGDDCVIYANATILGGATTVGAGSVIGGNVWLTESVPAGSKVFAATGRDGGAAPARPALGRPALKGRRATR